jgi:hypothetical protein
VTPVPNRRAAAAALSCLLSLAATLHADEGMWLLTDPPRTLLRERHDFDLTDEWLARARQAAVRFNNGGSGGFVSADGLIVTNHHVGADCLQKLSPRGKDYLRDGFHASSRDAELKCPDLELNVLESIEDVTDAVNAAVHADMTPAQANAARRAIMAKIEKESLDRTRLRSDVVTLYQGGNIIFTATRSTPRCAWCSRRSATWPRSAATWTTSSTRVSTSTSASFVYTDEQARHIAVQARAVIEALESLYGARALVEELTEKERR